MTAFSKKQAWVENMQAKYGLNWRDEMVRRGKQGGRPKIKDQYSDLPVSRQRKSQLRKKQI